MTLNLTPEDYSTTRDFAVITNDAADVAAIEATFNADFTDTTITAPTGDNLVWSPTNSRSALLALINGAAKTLLISQEEFDDTGIESAVEAAIKRGVAVTLVQENLNGAYSSVLNTLKAAGAQIAISAPKPAITSTPKTVLATTAQRRQNCLWARKTSPPIRLTTTANWASSSPIQPAMAGVEAAITADFTKVRNSEPHPAPQLDKALCSAGPPCGTWENTWDDLSASYMSNQ